MPSDLCPQPPPMPWDVIEGIEEGDNSTEVGGARGVVWRRGRRSG